jgi:protein-tyrosine phosphatase
VRHKYTDHDPPNHEEPWTEIRPLLWMGGHEWIGPAGDPREAVVTDEFDLVISLFARDGHGPDPGIEHVVFKIPDASLTATQIDGARRLGAIAAEGVQRGRNTLVRCRAGYNRSGLVVAQALIDLGLSASGAIALIRERRGSTALHNESFVAYLESGLDVA